ncbi:hypothetical protein C1925_05550 [Stenotrophomonas sp. SAU14A_NAIMI4_5]|nr:hypothetical protein C1925_05550 [Stenotrophomonas sp. SAU14A_NAIMI4_5]
MPARHTGLHMELHDPYRAPSTTAPPPLPAAQGPVDMTAITFSSEGRQLTAATIAAGYSSSLVVRRWLATIIDSMVFALVFFVPGVLLRETLAQTVMPFLLLLLVAYYPVMETQLGGSLGKLATGTRVVNLQGGWPSWWQSIIRTLMRLIEVNPMLIGGIPAGIAALVSRHHQRLGDMMARTYVLHREDIDRVRRSSRGIAAA